MKLFVSFRKSFLTGTFFILLSISCSEYNATEPNTNLKEANREIKVSDAIDLENYGEYHNEVLSVFLEVVDKDKSHSLKGNSINFRELIIQIKETVDGKNPTLINEQDYRETLENIDEVFGSFEDKNPEFDYYRITERLFKLKTSKRIGALFLDILHGSYSYKEILKIVDSFEMEHDLSFIEREQIAKFKVTLVASKELWQGKSIRIPISKGDCEPAAQQYLADAFGTIWGGLGAVGYSFAIYALQNSGLNCI
ncbi:hypothetical protein [Flagellimonas sp.]|uniref:hypothetical protein n=1 Tax=Flagellimonas sp. TaxID=2058762 RepID=UPI003B52A266